MEEMVAKLMKKNVCKKIQLLLDDELEDILGGADSDSWQQFLSGMVGVRDFILPSVLTIIGKSPEARTSDDDSRSSEVVPKNLENITVAKALGTLAAVTAAGIVIEHAVLGLVQVVDAMLKPIARVRKIIRG